MPICIECRTPVHTLYTTYSKADDRSLGKGVRLTQCPRCKRFADKYVEHDFVVVFIDLVLVKPQVYRHLLFNRVCREDGGWDRSILRLATLLLLFDVYLTWSLTETFAPSPLLTSLPLLTQYLFFLSLTLLSTLAFHLPIRFLTTLPPPSHNPHHSSSPLSSLRPLLPTSPSPNATSTALLVSSFTKLFPLLLLVWDYDARRSVQVAGWAVLASNVVALGILCGCGWGKAGVVVGVGAVVRGVVEGGMLGVAGVERGVGGVGGFW